MIRRLSFLGICLLVMACGSGPERAVEADSEELAVPATSAAQLTRSWILAEARSNLDSLQASIPEKGTRLFIESDGTYTVLKPSGKAETGVWKFEAKTAEVLFLPTGQPMKRQHIKFIKGDQLILLRKVQGIEDGWVESAYLAND